MTESDEKGVQGCITLILLMVVGGFLWPYTINSWLVYNHKEAVIVFWQGALLGLITGRYMLIAAIITWILMMVLN